MNLEITVRFYSYFRQVAGTDALSVELPDGATVATLVKALRPRFAGASPRLERAVFLVNSARAGLETRLGAGDEVAALFLLRGGSA